jgi:tetratricopeptide (TPR) repeat protein
MASMSCTSAPPRTRYALVVLLCAIVPIALAADSAHDFARYFEQGNSYFESAQYVLAVSEYDKAIECVVKAPPGYTLDYDATIFNYMQAYRNRTLAYLLLEDFDRVIRDSDVLIQLKDSKYSSQRSDGYYYKGRAFYQKKEYDSAIRELSNAIALAPSETKAYNYRMFAYYMIDEEGKARADCDAILRLDPKHESALLLSVLLPE